MVINGVWVWRWNDILVIIVFGESLVSNNRNFRRIIFWRPICLRRNVSCIVLPDDHTGQRILRTLCEFENNISENISHIIWVILYDSYYESSKSTSIKNARTFSFRSQSWQENGFFFCFFGGCGRGAIKVLKKILILSFWGIWTFEGFNKNLWFHGFFRWGDSYIMIKHFEI